MEYFIKAGLYQIGNEIIWNRANKHIDFKEKGLKQALQISKEEILLIRKYNLGSDYVELFQKMGKNHVKLYETEKKNFRTIYGINDALLSKNLLVSIRKIMTYLANSLNATGDVVGIVLTAICRNCQRKRRRKN